MSIGHAKPIFPRHLFISNGYLPGLEFWPAVHRLRLAATS